MPPSLIRREEALSKGTRGMFPGLGRDDLSILDDRLRRGRAPRRGDIGTVCPCASKTLCFSRIAPYCSGVFSLCTLLKTNFVELCKAEKHQLDQ